MDRISEQILSEFSKENGIEQLPEDERFENLATFLAVRRHYSRAFDTTQLNTGSGGDTGIDAIAIIVNGALVTDVDQVQELQEQNNYVEATFIFVQAERSASFDASKIGSFSFGVQDFFSESPKLPRNDAITNAAAIMSAVYNRSTAFRRRPTCRMYYITTGRWVEDQNLVVRRDSAKSDLLEKKIFDEVDFSCLGADDLLRLYQQTKNAIAREFLFEEKVEIPDIPGVQVAFLGYVPAPDFISIISDDAGDDILGSIFYDNVRDWQDYNPVNAEMRDTLASDKNARFVLMNNGITIIARSLKQSGSKFMIEDFQIVNGCQTSHVIFDQRKALTQSVAVPLRLIHTTDDDVIESIVLATNRQTELKPEQLYALTSFAKTLERFFETFPEATRLYYERRDGQYDRAPIERSRIVSPQNVIKAFAAMFLEEPHTSTKNYKSLRARVGSTFFSRSDKLEPYYVAAYAAYKLELQYRSHKLDSRYKSARYHLLLAFRLLADPQPLARMNSNEMEKRCRAMMEMLWDADKTDNMFQDARAIIDEVSGGKLDRDHIRTQNITQAILARSKQGTPATPVPAS